MLELAVEVKLNRCSRRNRKLAMTVLTDKPEVDRTDAAQLVKELAEIYTTPTPKGLRKAEKSSLY